jgi:predicted nucleic acid-binding protein
MAILVDTNILLRLRDPADPRYAACLAVLDSVQATRHGLSICAQVMIEYWVAATRPTAQNGFGLTPDEARSDLVRLRGFLPCLPEAPDVADRWLRLVTQHSVSGKPAHDTRLVALMEAHGVRRLLTLNPGDFARYPNVECVRPDQLLAAGP